MFRMPYVFGLLFTGNKSSFDITRKNLSLECWHACLVMSPLGLLLIKLLINIGGLVSRIQWCIGAYFGKASGFTISLFVICWPQGQLQLHWWDWLFPLKMTLHLWLLVIYTST